MCPRHLLLIPVLALFACSALGQEPEREAATPDATTMAARVDELLAARWGEEGVKPAPLSGDADFMRRVHLDLTGVVPSVPQARDFLSDDHSEKRSRLIDSLLDSPIHATYLASTWRRIMLPGGVFQGQLQNAARLESWLRTQFADNIRYDRVVADFLMAAGDQTGPVFFYTSQDLKPEKLAASTARIFLGLQLQCAQCHDHFHDKWTQQDFWGYAAFFARLNQSQDPRRQNRVQLLDMDRGEVMLPDSDVIVRPKYPGGAVASDEGGGTRRMQLAVWTASRDNPHLARATVNRVWAQMFGRGLVNPVDDFGLNNPPSHPELLEELSDFFVKNRFDLRELYRTLASTNAYQLTSRSGDADPPPHFFARMAAKPLTPEQLYDSLNQSLMRRPDDQSPDSSTNSPLLDPNRQEFLAKMPLVAGSATEYQSGVLQALALINGSDIADASDPEESGLLLALQAPVFTDEGRIEALMLATLSRPPSPEETSAFLAHLDGADSTSERRRALGDILWALLNSAEFAMNH